MLSRIVFWLLTFCLMLTPSPRSLATAEDAEVLSKKAVSLLRRECVSCHGPDKQEAGLRLDSSVFFHAGGDNGAVLPRIKNEPGRSENSQLTERIEHKDQDLLMPPKRRLSQSDVAILKEWVKAGAVWHAEEPLHEIPSSDTHLIGDAWSDPKNPIRAMFDGKRLDLWSLRPVLRPAIPRVKNIAWCRNPIDRFVLAQWEQASRVPVSIASDRVLVRRVLMDLTGLPPDVTQVENYLSDKFPDKYERLIDQELGSPSFGVHWARMWLDVVRYSDSNGFDWDELRPNAWRFRDYVVRSLNQDLPFDRFVEQQLAGDELLDGPPRDFEEQASLIATGYLRLGPQDNAAASFNEQDRGRAELMSDLTETTAGAFLGLTISCCRCHDHKTDPLSHADHYRLRAFFAACHYADGVSIDLQHDQKAIREHNHRLDAEIKNHEKSIAAIVALVSGRVPEKKVTANCVSDNALDLKAAKEQMTTEERAQLDKAESEIASLKKSKRSFTKGLLMHDKADATQPIFVLLGGDHRTPKEPVEPGFPSVLFPNTPKLVKPLKITTTGRRLTLARWIASRENPWTARVIVNRLWQNYFGQGIVATPNDFGVTGALPTHPDLLDYLAVELVESGWSLKHVHRLIITSSVYRQQSIAGHETNDVQEFSTLRAHLRRLSAEQLRDTILHVSGLLQERAGGPPIWPVLDAATLAANPAVLDDNETKTKGWYPSPLSDQSVRSLYLIQKRTIRIPWMETFDLPENAISCGRRECSLVAPQSLAMLNGSLSLQASQQIAETILCDKKLSPSQLVSEVFRQILLRNPADQELVSCQSFLETRSLVELCLVLLNTNEFAFTD